MLKCLNEITYFGWILPFGLWISYGLDSPLVHHFVRALTLDVALLRRSRIPCFEFRIWREREGKMDRKKITPVDVQAMKREGKRVAMLTAYDYPMALLEDRAGIEIPFRTK